MTTRFHTLAPCLALLAYLALPSADAQPRPGVTTRADVVARMGKPDMTFQSDVLAGDVDIDPTPGDSFSVDRMFRRMRGDADKRPIALYDVLQYWDGPTVTSRTSFVFLEGDDRLLYAVMHPSPSEKTYEAATKRYGREPVVERRLHEKGHIIMSTVHLVFAEEGVELVIERQDLSVSRKLYVHRDAKGHATLP
jgi:hypothetical protein